MKNILILWIKKLEMKLVNSDVVLISYWWNVDDIKMKKEIEEYAKIVI